MVKKALTLLTSILIALPLLMPFNIYGDTAIVVGTDVSLIDSTLIRTESYTEAGGTVNKNNILYTYKVTAQLDNNYVGYLLLKIDYSYYNNPQSGLRTDSSSITRRIFINGDKAEFNFTINTWYSTDPLLRNTTNATPNVTIQEQGVTLLSELDSIQQIIDILNDLYNSNDEIEGLLNNQLQQLQLIVSNTSLSNTYLEKITKLRQWNIPFESINTFISMMNRNIPIVDYINYNYFNYPVFQISNGNVINTMALGSNSEIYFIFFIENINIYDISLFNNYFSITGGDAIEWSRYSLSYTGNWSPIVRIKIKKDSNGGSLTVTYIGNNTVKFIPYYFNYVSNKYISTDFALQFGLSNQMLDDLHLIANGTAQSSSAAQSSNSTNSQLQTDSNTLFQQENGFKSDMQNAMHNVNNTFRLHDMGTKFVSSAQWVRTQYEQLTNNTPFSSLITFSLITGLALILLGKVYK